MRKSALILSLVSAAAMPGAAWSQSGQAPTAADYVCTFSGDCGQNGQNAQTDDQNPQGPRPRITATRGFALSRPDAPAARSSAPSRTVRPSAPRRMARNLASSSSATPAATSSTTGQRINLQVNFITGSASLTPGARAQARIFAQALMSPQLSDMHFAIEGHTDGVGQRDRNLDLSQRRAQAVADFLVAAGVGADRLVVRGYGPDRPLPNTRATAAANRRVEVVRIS